MTVDELRALLASYPPHQEVRVAMYSFEKPTRRLERIQDGDVMVEDGFVVIDVV